MAAATAYTRPPGFSDPHAAPRDAFAGAGARGKLRADRPGPHKEATMQHHTRRALAIIAATLLALAPLAALAQDDAAPGSNPLFRDRFTADPAPLVVGDRLYLYVGHDQARGEEMFNMREWLVYSTTDMKTWTDHGPLLCRSAGRPGRISGQEGRPAGARVATAMAASPPSGGPPCCFLPRSPFIPLRLLAPLAHLCLIMSRFGLLVWPWREP